MFLAHTVLKYWQFLLFVWIILVINDREVGGFVGRQALKIFSFAFCLEYFGDQWPKDLPLIHEILSIFFIFLVMVTGIKIRYMKILTAKLMGFVKYLVLLFVWIILVINDREVGGFVGRQALKILVWRQSRAASGNHSLAEPILIKCLDNYSTSQ